jgi:hypothetical protein
MIWADHIACTCQKCIKIFRKRLITDLYIDGSIVGSVEWIGLTVHRVHLPFSVKMIMRYQVA